MEYTSPLAGIKRKALVVIGIGCTGSCISNYYRYAITTTTAPMSYGTLTILYIVLHSKFLWMCSFMVGLLVITCNWVCYLAILAWQPIGLWLFRLIFRLLNFENIVEGIRLLIWIYHMDNILILHVFLLRWGTYGYV